MSFGNLVCEMSGAEMGSELKQTLKSLCCSNGWSYGVFWRFDHRNSMFLTFEDVYYEEQIGAVVNNMLLQVHMLGEGIIGQAALTGKHHWVFSDAQCGEWNSVGSVASQDVIQDDSEFHHQFSSGIKTIAVIAVGSQGVVQFGSTQKVLESMEFSDQTKRLLQEMKSFDSLIPLENGPLYLDTETYDLNGLFASLIPLENSYNGNLALAHGGSSCELMGNPCSSTSPTQPCFTSEVYQGKTTPMLGESSHVCDQLQTGTEAQVVLSSKPDTKFQPGFCSMSSVNNSNANTPSISAWSNGGSILTSFELPLPSERGIQDSTGICSAKSDTLVSCGTSTQNCQGESTFTSVCSTGVSLCSDKDLQDSSGILMDNPNSATERATDLHSIPEEFKQADFTIDISNSYTMDDLSQWFVPSPEYSINDVLTAMNKDHSQSIHATSVSSGLVGSDVVVDIPIKHSASSVQCSITDTVGSDRKEKCVIVQSADNDLFDALGLDFGCQRTGDSWEDTLMPVVSGVHSVISTGASECKSELDVGSMAGPRKGLFSELGLEELLESVSYSSSITKSGFGDHFSATKRRKTEISSSNYNPVQLAENHYCSVGSVNLMQHLYNWKTNDTIPKKEFLPKSQVGLWIDDSYSINAGKAVEATPKKREEPMKLTKKRARPGESTRPRPKDRQQIQDRIKELKGIIPNGAKQSIDALLDLTIKHMLFLQSVTKYADKLKQVDQQKRIDQQNGLLLKDSIRDGTGGSDGTGGGGATWAFEVGGQSMGCPIIVEDLSPPGHMLIEMLCEERGYFLEIADIIRGFGLNILKGVMEIRETKIWACFIVEANRHVTRLDIFWSLVQLLQQTDSSAIDSSSQATSVTDGRIPLLNGCDQQPLLPLPIGLTQTLQ